MASLGARGEDAAARHLRLRGWRIVARGWRCPTGEIDIAAFRGGVLALCEVKTRHAEAALVDPIPTAQRPRLLRTAEAFHARHAAPEVTCVRLDLILVRPGRLGWMRVRRVEAIDLAPPAPAWPRHPPSRCER